MSEQLQPGQPRYTYFISLLNGFNFTVSSIHPFRVFWMAAKALGHVETETFVYPWHSIAFIGPPPVEQEKAQDAGEAMPGRVLN